jgi:hypothetical protein
MDASWECGLFGIVTKDGDAIVYGVDVLRLQLGGVWGRKGVGCGLENGDGFAGFEEYRGVGGAEEELCPSGDGGFPKGREAL